MAAITYLQRWKTLNKMAQASTSGSAVDYGGGGTKTVSMFGKLVLGIFRFINFKIH